MRNRSPRGSGRGGAHSSGDIQSGAADRAVPGAAPLRALIGAKRGGSALLAQEKSLAESGDFDRRLDNAILDENQRHSDAIAAKESPVAPGFDREGMPRLTGVVGSIAELETQTRHRLPPRRNRWVDVAAFDERAAEFDARRTEVMSRLTPLQLELANAGNTGVNACRTGLVLARRDHVPNPFGRRSKSRSPSFSARPTR